MVSSANRVPLAAGIHSSVLGSFSNDPISRRREPHGFDFTPVALPLAALLTCVNVVLIAWRIDSPDPAFHSDVDDDDTDDHNERRVFNSELWSMIQKQAKSKSKSFSSQPTRRPRRPRRTRRRRPRARAGAEEDAEEWSAEGKVCVRGGACAPASVAGPRPCVYDI